MCDVLRAMLTPWRSFAACGPRVGQHLRSRSAPGVRGPSPLQKRERLDAARAALYVFFGFDHADEATALRTHSVGGRKTFSPVQTQRSHCGWVERYLEVQSQALSAKVARVLLEESNHDFA